MKRKQEMKKRCQALLLAGILGAGGHCLRHRAGRDRFPDRAGYFRRPRSDRK